MLKKEPLKCSCQQHNYDKHQHKAENPTKECITGRHKNSRLKFQCGDIHNGMQIEISNRKRAGNSTHIWRLNSTIVNNPWAKNSLKRNRKYFELH